MKHILTLILCLVATAATVAQTRIKAGDIIKQINEGRSVAYSNVEIEGDLDLTDLENRRLERSSTSWFNDDGGTYESTVEVSVNFTNCTFLGSVLAYYHVERKNETYVAHFEKDAVFRNCVFKNASEFKYSEFNGAATFTGCTFNEEANFKYAEFSSGPSFSNARFDSGANFKYTEFPRETSFEKATFRGLANFKYSKFRSPLKMDGVAFNGSEDFKYTRIDGRDFTSYLLDK
jgi:uncharacterized protein YjbI with pentapeptide repeats